MRPHLRYLRYVLLHKFYVLRAGLALWKVTGNAGGPWLGAWIWRLLVHDLSKFSRAEWTPYVDQFYGQSVEDVARAKVEREIDEMRAMSAVFSADVYRHEQLPKAAEAVKRDRKAAFNAAWLHHIHRNPHHWQHHILHEDSGKVLVLVPEAVLVYEMVADWCAAGPKVHNAHTMAEAVAETVIWYAANHRQMQMREIVRSTAELLLAGLSDHYGITDAARSIQSAQRARVSISIPGR